MPKNVKRQKKGGNTTDQKALILKEGSEQDYGQILKELGNLMFKIVDPQGAEYLGVLRGKMKGRQRVRVGDIVVFSHRCMTEDRKVDIIMKYTPDQAKRILRTERISFPDHEKQLLGKTEVLFETEDGTSTPPDAPRIMTGQDKIAAIYQDQDDSDLDSDYEIVDEEDEEDEVSETESDEADDEVPESDLEDRRTDKRHKIDHRRQAAAGRPMGSLSRPTAVSMLTGDIDIDAI